VNPYFHILAHVLVGIIITRYETIAIIVVQTINQSNNLHKVQGLSHSLKYKVYLAYATKVRG
jgi:hypothetical protein